MKNPFDHCLNYNNKDSVTQDKPVRLFRKELESLLNMKISGLHSRDLYSTEAPPSESDVQPNSGITGLGYTRQKSKKTRDFY